MGNTINIFTDGASRGNPGLAGVGVVIYENNVILEQVSEFIGNKTNNEAEYMAVIKAFESLVYLKNEKKVLKNISKVNLFADSQFLIKQLKKEYSVKSEKIKPLYSKVLSLLNDINLSFTFNWIPRSENSIADSLANKGIDNRSTNDSSISDDNNNFGNNSNNKISSNLTVKNEDYNNCNLDSYIKNDSLILERAFFGKINCFKLQMNKKREVYFHIGILDNKSNNWRWNVVKINDIEIGDILNILDCDEGKCSFFHKFAENSTQIWCNKSKNSFSIKIKDISKNFSVGEFQVLKILLKECIIRQNFI